MQQIVDILKTALGAAGVKSDMVDMNMLSSLDFGAILSKITNPEEMKKEVSIQLMSKMGLGDDLAHKASGMMDMAKMAGLGNLGGLGDLGNLGNIVNGVTHNGTAQAMGAGGLAGVAGSVLGGLMHQKQEPVVENKPETSTEEDGLIGKIAGMFGHKDQQ
jgi:hypothetical protein